MTASPAPRRRVLRATTVFSVPMLIVTGLATFSSLPATAAPVPAAVPLPAGAESFLVSPTDEGVSDAPFLTSDGQRVFYSSTATDLVDGDDNGVADIFVSVAAQGSSDPFSGTPVLVSAPDGPVGAERADGPSIDPVATANGRYVAFTSTATNLTADPAEPGRSYVFVRDLIAERTFRVQGPEAPNGDSYEPDLTDDGRFLVFTSTATNFTDTGGDANPDALLADLDSNGDGVLGDMTFSRVSGQVPLDATNVSPQISGNGRYIYFLSDRQGVWSQGTIVATPEPTTLYRVERGYNGGELVFTDVREPSVDSSGHAVAYIANTVCGGDPVVLASAWDSGFYTVAVGWLLVRRSVGVLTSPTISADGSLVAWSTTQPRFDFSDPAQGPLEEPVVRMEEPAWWDAPSSVQCAGIVSRDWVDVGEGAAPSLSASGRTVAYSGSSDAAPGAEASVVAVDRNTHQGLSVSTTQGEVVDAGFMTGANILEVPITQLRGYASALANAPIHRLPIHRLPIHRLPIHRLPIHRLLVEDAPIHRLPIHRLPIHRLPIHRLDIPGGWAELLAATPFAGELIQSVTLDQVLAWADENIDSPDEATRLAAERIQSLTLADVALDGSGIDSLSIASLVLGSVPVVQVEIAGGGTTEERWQARVDAQGLGVDVDGESLLAELDATGLDIGRSGVESVPLRSIPVDLSLFGEVSIASTADDPGLFLTGTPLGAIPVDELSESARTAVFDGTPSGTIEQNLAIIRPDATVADLSVGVPERVTFGDLLFSLFDTESYPWEQVAPFDMIDAYIGTSPGACTAQVRCVQAVEFRFTFDVGPGESTTFPAPTATITLPPETRSNGVAAAATGPDVNITDFAYYGGTVQIDGTVLRMPLADTPAGTTYAFSVDYPVATSLVDGIATGELTSGGLSASASLSATRSVSEMDDPMNERRDGDWFDPLRPGQLLSEDVVYYEWISPLSKELNDEGEIDPSPAGDEDWFRIRPPAAGERLIVSTNANDGQIAMALYSPGDPVAPLGTTDAGSAPGVAVVDDTGTTGRSTAGADAAPPLEGHSLVGQVSVGGDGIAEIEAASTDASAEEMLLRVFSGNGLPSSSLYSVRVRYLEEPEPVRCAPWTPATADVVPPMGDAIEFDTNTLFVIDAQRYASTHGIDALMQTIAAIDALEGTGAPGAEVHPAVISVDASAAVRSARAALDANPCAMPARAALVTAINAHIDDVLADARSQITSVVIVGGDDIVPFAPVAQNTAQFNEASHADSLRLEAPLAGGACPATVPDGTIDPCATPLSAAAATNHILTDDPYALATAYRTLGGHLYVPSVGVGRLVDSPEQILAALQRFVDADGVLQADSSLTAGYGAWSELPALVSARLDWRDPTETELTGTWDRSVTEAALFPETGPGPRVVSINTHADERRMLPGIPGAETGVFADGDLVEASGRQNAPQLADALVFLIGCHAGNNLPGSYYGDVADWADVFSTAGGYVGNTGYGLANSISTALSERLLAYYADWVGVTAGGLPVTTAGALTFAKQSYLGGLGLYSGYDEKVLMQAVYYGLPMYTLSARTPAKSAPLPEVPAGLQAADIGDLGILSASLNLKPEFTAPVGPDGSSLGYLVADGQEPAIVAGQPVLPKIVARLAPAPEGSTPRGAVLTSLTSVVDGEIDVPAVTEPGVGIDDTVATRTDTAFPSSFATVTRQETPQGFADMLVVTPARVTIGQGGRGVVEKFTDLTVEATYGPADSNDVTPPRVLAVELPTPGSTQFAVRADDVESPIVGMVLLIQREGQQEWQRITVTEGSTAWLATVPDEPFRWILQVVDAAGNVATETARGRLPVAAADAPDILATGGPAEVAVGERLVRSMEITDSRAGDLLTATYTLLGEGGEAEASGTAVVETTPTGVTYATIDRVLQTAGSFTVRVDVCRSSACTTVEFPLDVPFPNTAPTATASITSDTPDVRPTSVLTAVATGADVDGDDVEVYYTWLVNGVEKAYNEVFDLATAGVTPGQVVALVVTPYDGQVSGHTARAEVTVAPEPEAPAITLSARNADGDYVEGEWSRSAVTVTFACTSGVSVTTCPETEVVTETTVDGYTVVGIMVDELGRSATARILVRVDGVAPELAPTVTPFTVEIGGTATAEANATDAGSGVASESCTQPDTSTEGSRTVECTATDVAGNTATATAGYTVSPPAAPQCAGVLDRVALSPLNADGSSVFLRSSGVPVVFRACDADGTPIGTKKFVTGVTQVSSAPLPAGARINELWYPPINTFIYAKKAQTWVGMIPTRTLRSGTSYTYLVSLSDGTSFELTFGVR